MVNETRMSGAQLIQKEVNESRCSDVTWRQKIQDDNIINQKGSI